MDADYENLLADFNLVFTWLFIYELAMKVLAIGIGKYCADKMNYIDGTVVLLSIVEMLIELVADDEGGGSLKDLSALRILRAFRVFRIGRLLRALESMQTII